VKSWPERAAEARAAGDLPGNGWELMPRRSLERTRPELLADLAPEVKAYLEVRTASAMDLAERLEDQGTSPEVARELAMAQLLGSSD
jgi:hypothetical protein